MRSGLRRWCVPLVAVASIVVPSLIGLGFPQLGGYGGSGCFDGFEECARYCEFGSSDREFIRKVLDEPIVLPDEESETGSGMPSGANDPTDPADTGEKAAPPPPGPRIPDAVTRPRIDPNLQRSPGYQKPPVPKSSKY